MPDSNPFEARMLAALDRASSAPAARRTPMPSSPRAVHSGDLALAAVRKPVETPEVNRSSDDRDLTKAKAPIIQAKAIKCVINLDPAQLLGLRVRDGDERTMLIVEAGGRRVAVDLASKSVRKTMKTILENGVDGTFCGLQGRLLAGDVLADAGLSAQLKAPKPQVG